MSRKLLFVPMPPVSEVRTTVSGPLTLTRPPSYCSAVVLVGVSLSCVVVPTKNGGSALPDDTLRAIQLGLEVEPLGARISVRPPNSAVLPASMMIESPIAQL